MLTTERAAAIIAPMSGYSTGDATRAAIILALLEREPQTIQDLADATGTSRPNVSKILRGMERDGVVTAIRQTGRGGADVRLTPCARETARIVRLA